MNRFLIPKSGRGLNLANQEQYVDLIWILTKTNHLKRSFGRQKKKFNSLHLFQVLMRLVSFVHHCNT